MHMCWLGGHFDAEYTPSEYLRGRECFPLGHQTALAERRLRSRPRRATESANEKRTVLEDGGAQGVAVLGRPARRIVGCINPQHRRRAGCTSTLSVEGGDEVDISISFQCSAQDEATVLPPLGAVARNLSSTSVARSARIG